MKLAKWRCVTIVEIGGGQRLALRISLGEEPPVPDHARLGIELVGHLGSLLVDQAAVFEEQLRAAKVDDRQLGVGRLALILVAKAAAEADDGLRHGPVGHGPAGDVHLVHALVANLAVAEIPKPMPIVMHEVLVIRLLGRRTEPEIEVELLGRLLWAA